MPANLFHCMKPWLCYVVWHSKILSQISTSLSCNWNPTKKNEFELEGNNLINRVKIKYNWVVKQRFFDFWFSRLDKDKMTMLRVLRQFFSLSATDYSDDEILHICGVLFVNAHEVPVTATPTQAIFRSASLVEHSCVNNASKHFDMNCNIQVVLIWW